MSKVSKVLHEFKRGELHSGSKHGRVVKKRSQAIAIALSEARKAGEKVSPKPEGKRRTRKFRTNMMQHGYHRC